MAASTKNRFWVIVLAMLAILAASLAYFFKPAPSSPSPVPSPGAQAENNPDQAAQEMAQKIKSLDQTLWAPEVAAQKHEEVFIKLWDALRSSNEPLKLLGETVYDSLSIPVKKSLQALPLKISLTQYKLEEDSLVKGFSRSDVQKYLAKLSSQGYQIIQSEFHHSTYIPPVDGKPAQSQIAFELHLAVKAKRLIAKGELQVTWKAGLENSGLEMKSIRVNFVNLYESDEPSAFVPIVKYKTPDDVPNNVQITPLSVVDLNEDGLVDIVFPAMNEVLWNKGNFKFERTFLLGDKWKHLRSSLFADFNGDGHIDCLGVINDGPAIIYWGLGNGSFSDSTTTPWNESMEASRNFTAGDIDGDGDLDVYATQYKSMYFNGSMPTPFYDANDGFPAYLFINDGKGNFKDETSARIKGLKRNRRTFTSSLVDLDYDRDLDLLVVSDFSGIDVYENTGKGEFIEATGKFFKERNTFGMGHEFGNFDGDGKMDLYVAGMSSTTARRLKRLGLARNDFPEYTVMREAMTFGNRLYQRKSDLFLQTDLNKGASRAGWTWGISVLDFDNNGFDDIYVANGHMSGKTSKDYCTRYWTQDIYTGDSKERPEIQMLFSDKFQEDGFKGLNKGDVSWNGFEKNRFYMNVDGKDFHDVGFLMGVSLEPDSRTTISADFDNDGRQDLMVVFLNRDFTNSGSDWRQEMVLFKNQQKTDHNWIAIEPAAGNSAPFTGAMVEISGPFGKLEKPMITGQTLDGQQPYRVHFGLGKIKQISKITVKFPDGTDREIVDPAINKLHRLTKTK